jgi:aminopeptidase-like protein
VAGVDRSRVPSETEAVGSEMSTLMAELYPICRSLTGDGVRETLAIPQTMREAADARRANDPLEEVRVA